MPAQGSSACACAGKTLSGANPKAAAASAAAIALFISLSFLILSSHTDPLRKNRANVKLILIGPRAKFAEQH